MLQSLLCSKICEASQTLQIKRPTNPTMGLSLLPRDWRCRLRLTRICRRGLFSTEPVFSRKNDVSRRHSFAPLLTALLDRSKGSQTGAAARMQVSPFRP